MRLSKRFLKRAIIKRLTEFILMNSLIIFFILGVYTGSGTGVLYQLGDDWYIDSLYRHNHSYSKFYIGIDNPDSFPNVLIPENNGTEVHFNFDTHVPFIGPFRLPIFVRFNSLELLPVFILKQSILFCSVAISGVIVFIYIYFNRKKFLLTNKLLK